MIKKCSKIHDDIMFKSFWSGFVIEKGHYFLWPEVAHFSIRIIDSRSLCLPSNPRFTSSTTEDWCSERATLMLLKNCFISTFLILSNTLLMINFSVVISSQELKGFHTKPKCVTSNFQIPWNFTKVSYLCYPEKLEKFLRIPKIWLGNCVQSFHPCFGCQVNQLFRSQKNKDHWKYFKLTFADCNER